MSPEQASAGQGLPRRLDTDLRFPWRDSSAADSVRESRKAFKETAPVSDVQVKVVLLAKLFLQVVGVRTDDLVGGVNENLGIWYRLGNTEDRFTYFLFPVFCH